MLSIVLIGTGNVARHLFDAFSSNDRVNVLQVVGRNKTALNYFKTTATTSLNYENLKDADVYIIALSDDAISTVSEKLNIKNGFLVHTSGSVDMKTLNTTNRAGVFYPLQTFSPERKIDFKEVPICVEAENEEDLKLLKKLAAALGSEVFEVSSKQRRSLHLAAVFANNFVNHLFTIASEICIEQQLPFSILQPLILETAEKIRAMPPINAQTGPAKRNDIKTMELHMQLLKSERNKQIYSLLSESILTTYGKKL